MPDEFSIKHQINMSNFINQFKKEHDLIDELVSNAFESAERVIKVIHKTDSIIFYNDGIALSIDNIKNKLLTAFETGGSFDTNRGLGFISIYGYMEYTIVETGTHRLRINSWSDIQIERSYRFIEGIRIEVFLDENAKKVYSYKNVKDNLKKWIYYSEIELLFGKGELEQIGNKLDNKLKVKSHRKFKYQNLKYTEDIIIDDNINFLLKLGNVDTYRVLPIYFNTGDMIVSNITLIISHGSYLDASRRSLSKFGHNQVSRLLTLINNDRLRKALNKDYFHIVKSVKNEIARRRDYLVDNRIISYNDGLQMISNVFNNLGNIASIKSEIVNFDKLIELLGIDRFDKISNIISTTYSNIDDEITADTFRQWFKNRFSISILDLFSDTIIGLRYNYGILEGEARLKDLEHSHWISFDEKLFTSKVLQNEQIIIAFEIINYFIDDTYRIHFDELVKKHVKRVVNDIFSVDEIGEFAENIIYSEFEGIKCLIYPSGKDLFDKFKQNGNLMYYKNQAIIWDKLIALIIAVFNDTMVDKKIIDENYRDILGNITGVLLFGNTDTLACKIGTYIAINHDQIPDISDNTVSKTIKFVSVAIHEVSHIYEPTHSNRFYKIEAQILHKLQNNTFATNYIEKLFCK